MTLKKLIYFLLFVVLSFSACTSEDTEGDEQQFESQRSERKFLIRGNDAFAKRDFQSAANYYRQALESNPSSPEALYNNAVATMALAESMMAKSGDKPDSTTMKIAEEAEQMYLKAAMFRGRATGIAALSCYNLGNRYFRTDNLEKAEDMYREALRLNPDFEEARRNLRITQLKKQQNQDQNKDKDKDQNKNQNDQNQQQQQNQQQDQQQNQQDKDKDKEQNQQPNSQPKPQSNMTEQAAQQILNSNQAREQGTRARLERSRQQRPQQGGTGKKW